MKFVFEVSSISDSTYSAICYEDYVKTLEVCLEKIKPRLNEDSLACLQKRCAILTQTSFLTHL